MTNQPPRCRVKIERAKEHIADLERRFADFAATHPYRAIFHHQDQEDGWEPQTTWTYQPHKVSVAPFDPIWGVIVGEIAHNCRSCLDNAWNEIVLKTTKHERGAGAQGGFPFYPDSYKKFRGKEKGAIQSAVNHLRSVEADKARHPLATLALLDNIDKHETHIFCAAKLDTFREPDIDPVHPSHHLSRLEEGTELLLRLPPGEMYMEHQLRATITFAETKVTNGEPVIPTLEVLTGTAENVIDAFLALGIVN